MAHTHAVHVRVHICIRMYRYHRPVRPAQPQHTVRACACARNTHAPRPRCAPRKGSARRSLRRTAEVEQRDARPDESHSAGHARCAAPDRPVVQPLCPFGLVCGCSLGFALPGGYRRLVRHAAAEGTTNASVPTQLSTPSSLRSSSACLPTVPTVRKRGCPAVHCVGTRPNQRQSHRLRCARSQAGGAPPKNLFPGSSAGSAQVPAPHCPMLQPTDDAEGLVRVPRAKHTRAKSYMPTHAHTAPLHGWEAARSSAC
jgi:hypothetical protein